MIKANYHLHSDLSADGHASLLEMARAAARLGFAEVCFTEHLDFDRDDPFYSFFDADRYRREVEDARGRLEGELLIRTGVEFDFRREYGREPGEVVGDLGFDFCMGSVHSAMGVQIFNLNKERPEKVEGRDLRTLQEAYFDEVEALVASGWADGLGHFDYLYKQWPHLFERYRDDWYWERVEAILSGCIEMGVAIEVNSHHIHDKRLGLAADPKILERYRAMGGKLLTVGSDAHRPGDVDHGYETLTREVKAAGFAEVTGYEAGEPYAIPI